MDPPERYRPAAERGGIVEVGAMPVRQAMLAQTRVFRPGARSGAAALPVASLDADRLAWTVAQWRR